MRFGLFIKITHRGGTIPIFPGLLSFPLHIHWLCPRPCSHPLCCPIWWVKSISIPSIQSKTTRLFPVANPRDGWSRRVAFPLGGSPHCRSQWGWSCSLRPRWERRQPRWSRHLCLAPSTCCQLWHLLGSFHCHGLVHR